MKVLVACEFSGIVRDAFLAKGHDAWSCDLLPTESPGPHIEGDVIEHLEDGWDLMIAHPPCTFLSNAGGHYIKELNSPRYFKMVLAAGFFNHLRHAPIPKIAIENPIQHGWARNFIPKYDQKINPFQFGEPEQKNVCLWLKGLPKLTPTNDLGKPDPRGKIKKSNGRNYFYWFHQGKSQKKRSVFFRGIANAMAEQWGVYD